MEIPGTRERQTTFAEGNPPNLFNREISQMKNNKKSGREDSNPRLLAPHSAAKVPQCIFKFFQSYN